MMTSRKKTSDIKKMCIYKDSHDFFVDIDTTRDITDSSVFDIKFKKPSGNIVTFSGYLLGTTVIRYRVKENDIDEVGEWCGQAIVDTPTYDGPGKVFFMMVEEQVE